MFSVQSSENSPCAVFGDGAFCERVESKKQPSDWCCPQESPFTCLQFKYSPTYFFIIFFPGSGFIMCSGKENPDSDADLDVDGDDTLEYGKPQYRFLKGSY